MPSAEFLVHQAQLSSIFLVVGADLIDVGYSVTEADRCKSARLTIGTRSLSSLSHTHTHTRYSETGAGVCVCVCVCGMAGEL